MTPPEVGGRVVLALLDNRAADGAGSGEQIEQGIAIAPADRALERGQILREALEHLKHRILVRQEDVRSGLPPAIPYPCQEA